MSSCPSTSAMSSAWIPRNASPNALASASAAAPTSGGCNQSSQSFPVGTMSQNNVLMSKPQLYKANNKRPNSYAAMF